MANKPHIVRLSQGQATLIYMPQEKAEEYEKVLLAFDEGKDATIESGKTLEKSAVGLHLNPLTKRYELVIVNYNPLTRETKLVSIEDAGSLKNRAEDNFRKAVIKLKLV